MILKRRSKYMKLYTPDGEFLGRYPVSVSYRTAEEVESGDVLFTNLRLSVYADRHRSPSGGYIRGMILESEDGGDRYRVLVPVMSGRMWVIKAEAVMADGDPGICRDGGNGDDR